MKRREVIIALIIFIILVTAVVLIKKSLNKKLLVTPVATPSIQQRIDDNFPGLVIPNDIEKAELKDVSGGDNMGIATRTEILANLPDLKSGQYYQVWLSNGVKQILLGNMRIAKAGWLLEYKSSDYPGYNKIIVTLNNTPVLEGSF
ncbi:MAG TPA: hypothetical protein VL401_00485 [Alphaproteobacteria bacterium]|jgi:hypothetical protein|nr:hypothetical protein [Alphaproteobacteria bacterium]